MMAYQMVAPPAQARRQIWTYDDYLRLPDDGKRYEILYGVLHEMPAPLVIHQIILANLTFLLTRWVRERQLGLLLFAPIDLLIPSIATPVQPDALLIAPEQRGILKRRRVEGVPRLVVEVLSRSSTVYDRKHKFVAYEDAGIGEYWIVNPKTESVEIYKLSEDVYILAGEFRNDEKPMSSVLGDLPFTTSEIFIGAAQVGNAN